MLPTLRQGVKRASGCPLLKEAIIQRKFGFPAELTNLGGIPKTKLEIANSWWNLRIPGGNLLFPCGISKSKGGIHNPGRDLQI
jgi:hypothetical protein